jgi:hypothetical protein
MKGYLEVGATRVVRATGADEDWMPRALRKMAEGRGRKLEAIADLYQNDVSLPIQCFYPVTDQR